MACALSAYSEILGRPGEGLHAWRIPGTNTAAVDTALTLALAWALARFSEVPLVVALLAVFALGLLAHAVFGVPTQAVQWLGLTC